MLDAKDILQIDATIIAGIFIFLTIGSIGEHPTIAKVVNDFIKKSDDLRKQLEGNQTKLFQLTNELQNITLEKNQILGQINDINFKPIAIQGQIFDIDSTINGLSKNMTATPEQQNAIKAKINDLQVLKQKYVKELSVAQQKNGLKELQDNLTKTEQNERDVKSQINQTNSYIGSLKQEQTQESEKFKADSNKASSSFLKKPEDWVYEVGGPIGFSAIFALMSDIFERYDMTRPSARYATFMSLISMGIGFAFIIAIFFVMGGGPSYYEH